MMVDPEEGELEFVHLETPISTRQEIWNSLHDSYQSGHFTDLELVCSDDSSSIYCHQIVLASVSKTLNDALRGTQLENATVVIPGQQFQELKHFVDQLYQFFQVGQGEIFVSNNIASLLKVGQDVWLKSDVPTFSFKSKEEQQQQNNLVKLEQPSYDDLEQDSPTSYYQDLPWLNNQEEEEEDEKPLRKRKKRKTAATAKTVIKKKKLKLTEGNENNDKLGTTTKPKIPKKRQWRGDMYEKGEVYNLQERKKLSEVMKEANATLEVDMLDEVLDVDVHCDKTHSDAAYFQALVGLASCEKPGQFFAKPLAWSFPDDADLTFQFNLVFDAYRALFGFSDGDICYTNYMYSRQGLQRKCRGRKVRHEYKRKYAKLSDDELVALGNRPDVIEATKRYPMKANMNIPAKTCKFVLDGNLTADMLEGVAMITWTKATGEIEGRIMNVNPDDRETDSLFCTRAVFDIWCLGMNLKIPDSEYLRQRYDSLIAPMEIYWVVNEFTKNDPDRKLRDSILQREKQCPDCGKIFTCITVNHELTFTAHKRMHKYDKFECDCNIPFASLDEKILHVKLFHSEGKYIKCEKCEYVGTKLHLERHACYNSSSSPSKKGAPLTKMVKRQFRYEDVGGFICCEENFDSKESITQHVEQYHDKEKYVKCDRCRFLGSVIGVIRHKKATHGKDNEELSAVCELCGKALVDEKALAAHMRIHTQFRCEVCGEFFIGVSRFETHQKNAHDLGKKEIFNCEVCGKDFPRRYKLKHHFIRKHMLDKDMPFQCEPCGRGFPHKHALSVHQMRAHIKARPFKCRYGCGADYNDHSDRSSHELKKHGARFPNEKLANKGIPLSV